MIRRTALVTLLALAVGCSGKKTPKHDDDDHSHGAGPHGGTVFDICSEKYHLEFTVDHDKQEAKVYVFGANPKKTAAIDAKTLTVKIKEPAFQVELKPEKQKDDPEGKASVYVGKHEKLGKEQEFAGTVEGTIDGKPCTAEFAEKPAK